MKPFFVDTSGWCAVYDRSDDNHGKALSFWQKIASTAGTLYTSDYVMDETLTLLRVRTGHTSAVEFGRLILASKVVKIVPVSASRWKKAWELFIKFGDKDFSFTDCTSFIIMQELHLREVLGFDHHFRQMGFILLPD
ncbi:MAG: PIN domain-containing protein [Moorella sp. (in: firmicutes)]